MPRRAPIGNQHAIELALTEEQLTTLVQACRALRIPRNGWQEIDALNRIFSTLAIVNRATDREVAGDARRDALTAAAIELGLTESAGAVALDWRREWKRNTATPMP